MSGNSLAPLVALLDPPSRLVPTESLHAVQSPPVLDRVNKAKAASGLHGTAALVQWVE
jgi:hypothetical protein